MGFNVRTTNLGEALKCPPYGPNTSLFTVELYHGGHFAIVSGQKIYVGGTVNHIDFCHPNQMSFLNLYDIAYKLGSNCQNFYFKKLGDGLDSVKEIADDKDVTSLCKIAQEGRVVVVYGEIPVQKKDSNEDNEQEDDSDTSVSEELERFDGSDEELGNNDELFNVPITNCNSIITTPQFYEVVQGQDVDILNQGYAYSDGSSSKDSSDSDGNTRKMERKFTRVDVRNVKFEVGMRFNDGDCFKGAVTAYALQEGRNVTYKRNSKLKYPVKCDEGCPWKIFATQVKNEETVRVTSFYDLHTCSRKGSNRNLKSRVIAKMLLEPIRNHPKWKTTEFKDEVSRTLKCTVTINQAQKALQIARKMISGSAAGQYKYLWSYLEEIKRTNPGTTAKMKVAERGGPNGEAVFRCLYIGWASLRKGFISGCRPVIGVDGCHLTGPHKGVLLAAVAIDANNCMYPFAYGVVQVENYKNWRWFLKLVRDDLKIDSGEYTFISDKQKGLIRAVEEVLPGVEHRFCVRHLYNNFKQKYKGLLLKDILWEAARASTLPYFRIAMEKMKNANIEAHDWLSDKPGAQWSRSYFRILPQCDILLNNLCESFNAAIKGAREKPILDMLEAIRMYLMDLVAKKKTAMSKLQCYLCPKVQNKLEQVKLQSHMWIPDYNGDKQFEVRGMQGIKFAVDTEKRTCGCRKWDLTGIPCVHAIACMNFLRKSPEEYVHQCYKRETYLATYSYVLYPMEGIQQWPKSDKPIVVPWEVKSGVGRPKKARRRDPSEKEETQLKKARRHGMIMTCRTCGMPGHNLRSCNKVVGESSGTKKGGIKKNGTKSKQKQTDKPNENVDVPQTQGNTKSYVINEMDDEVWNELNERDDLWNLTPEAMPTQVTDETAETMPTQIDSEPSAAKKLNVRSGRLKFVPKINVPRVQYVNLCDKEEDVTNLHAGILKSKPKGPDLPRGNFTHGGKLYTTVQALKKAKEIEIQKNKEIAAAVKIKKERLESTMKK